MTEILMRNQMNRREKVSLVIFLICLLVVLIIKLPPILFLIITAIATISVMINISEERKTNLEKIGLK